MSLIESAARSAYSGAIDLGVMPSELDGGVASRAAIRTRGAGHRSDDGA